MRKTWKLFEPSKQLSSSQPKLTKQQWMLPTKPCELWEHGLHKAPLQVPQAQVPTQTAICPVRSTQRLSKCRSTLAKMDKMFRKPANKFAWVWSYSLQGTTPHVCWRGHKRHLWHAIQHGHRLWHGYCPPHRSLWPSPKQRHGYLWFLANKARTRRVTAKLSPLPQRESHSLRIPQPRRRDQNTDYPSYLGFQNLLKSSLWIHRSESYFGLWVFLGKIRPWLQSHQKWWSKWNSQIHRSPTNRIAAPKNMSAPETTG